VAEQENDSFVVVLGDRLAYGVEEVAIALSLSPKFVRNMMDSGELPTFRAGRRRLTSRADVLEWIARQKAASQPVSTARRSANTSVPDSARQCRIRTRTRRNDGE
jgi:excisionase family DNA binding protein